MFNYIFSENHAFLDNDKKCGTVRQATDDNKIWRRRFSCRINKAKIQTHSKYLILIAVPRQEWLRECASKSR